MKSLLSEVHGVDAEFVVRPPRVEEMLEENDAALVIGDPALKLERSGHIILDLAEEWRALTGFPFVFAVWAVRGDARLGPLAAEFSESLQAGLRDLERIVEEAARELDLDQDVVRAYLTRHLSFNLGPAELDGMREFFRRSQILGLVDSVPKLSFWT